MARKRKIQPETTGATATETATQEKDEAVYSFPTRSRCPRCHGLNTLATHTRGSMQYRQCQSAVCQRRYSVEGTRV